MSDNIKEDTNGSSASAAFLKSLMCLMLRVGAVSNDLAWRESRDGWGPLEMNV